MEPTSSREIPARGERPEESRVLRHGDGGWEGVPALAYKDDPRLFQGVVRRLVAAPASAAFELRYFEIEPGGYSTWEHHRHVHVVVCFRGRGRVRLGAEAHDLGFGDVVYVAPGEKHQFLNPHAEEPFGFLCIVDRVRDAPHPAGG